MIADRPNARIQETSLTVRPKEELGIELAQHLHNVIWYEYEGRVFLLCQSWNPGCYFVLEQVS
jgi:hypothetical protein